MFLANINGLRQRENFVAGLHGAKFSERMYWHIYSSNDERENETSSDSPVKALQSLVDNVFISVFYVHVLQFIGHESEARNCKDVFLQYFLHSLWNHPYWLMKS